MNDSASSPTGRMTTGWSGVLTGFSLGVPIVSCQYVDMFSGHIAGIWPCGARIASVRPCDLNESHPLPTVNAVAASGQFAWQRPKSHHPLLSQHRNLRKPATPRPRGLDLQINRGSRITSERHRFMSNRADGHPAGRGSRPSSV